MLTTEPTANPDAQEIHRDGKSIATLRKDSNGEWSLWIPQDGSGATIVPADLIRIAETWIGLMKAFDDIKREIETD